MSIAKAYLDCKVIDVPNCGEQLYSYFLKYGTKGGHVRYFRALSSKHR